jgi:hypothetical protein
LLRTRQAASSNDLLDGTFAYDGLAYFDFEKRVVGMLMTPPVIFGLVDAFGFWECHILSMLLPEIDPVGPIFMIVPGVIIATVAIVIPFFLLMVLSHSRYGNEPRCSQ